MKIGAVVLAGGKGTRMHSRVQKQYRMLAGKPLILYALEAFEHSQVDHMVLVVGQGERERVCQEILGSCRFDKLMAVTEGGRERYHSVYAAVEQSQACVTGMPVKDTIKKGDQDGFAAGSLDRSCLWQIQTPQAFSYSLIRTAYDWIMEEEERQTGITDDAMAVESYGGCRVKLVEGSYENLKVTTPEDMVIAEALLQCRGIDPESELL